MGYYTDYYSTFLKSPWAISFKQRWESRRLIRDTKKVDRIIFEKLPKEIEIEHKVTNALKDEDKAIDAIKDVINNGFKVAFNTAIQEHTIFEAVHKINYNLRKIHVILDRKVVGEEARSKVVEDMDQLTRELALIMSKAVNRAEKFMRDEMKELMTLIREADKHDSESFMAAVRARFKTLNRQSILARLAFRYDTKREKKAIEGLNALVKGLDEISEELDVAYQKDVNYRKKELPKLANRFRELIPAYKKDLERAYYYSHQIKKRDFLLLLVILVDVNILEQIDKRWIGRHFLPEAPGIDKISKLKSLEKALATKLHIIAQSLRISIDEAEKAVKESQQNVISAKRG